MKRIFLLSSHPLFSTGVEILLRKEKGLEFLGRETDVERAIEQIKKLGPDVVIVGHTPSGCELAPIVVRILTERPGIKIIVLNLEDNRFHIYRGELRTAQGVEDLMEAIENGANTGEPVSVSDCVSLATYRSRVYAFLAAVFNRLPDDQFASNMASPEMAAFLASLVDAEDELPEVREGVRLVEQFIQASKGKPVDELKTDLGVERTRLVRGLEPTHSPLPPYEAEYVGSASGQSMEGILSVARIYSEAGVGLPEQLVERPDFIGLELDFMRLLTEKESQAWVQETREEVTRLLAKEQAFLEEHITRWMPKFCDAMLQYARLDFYRGIAQMTKGFVLGEAQKVAELSAWARAEQAA